MESEKIKIFIILIGGIPGIGKTFLSNLIREIYFSKYEIKYLNFDEEEKINSSNYIKFKSMRDDYIEKFQEIINKLEEIKISSLIILDDNFYLKSMRKKIYKIILSKMIEIKNKELESNLAFYYEEILLKPVDVKYALNLNSQRIKNIPENIILEMHKLFEYSSPYCDDDKINIINLNDKNDLYKYNFGENEKYKIILKNENIISLNKKNEVSIFIDKIENGIRKKISDFIKNSDAYKKQGKNISNFKKNYLLKIVSFIKNHLIDKEINKNVLNKLDLYINLYIDDNSDNENKIKIENEIISVIFEDIINHINKFVII